MLQKILVPLDGSRLAEQVLSAAVRIVGPVRGDLVLLHAVTPTEWFSLPAQEYVARERLHSLEYLSSLSRRLADEGVKAQERLVTGEPSRAIVLWAAQEKVDLIALTTHGRSGVREWAFGSVAERVLRSTLRPVLLHRGWSPPPAQARRIVVTLDREDRSLAVVPVAADLAEAIGGEILFLHVGRSVPESVEKALASVARRNFPVHLRLMGGDPPAAILLAAEEEKAEILALTAAGRSIHGRVSFGATGEELVRRADRSVLVVPAALD